MHAVVNTILPPDRPRELRQETYRRSLELEGKAENVVVMRKGYAAARSNDAAISPGTSQAGRGLLNR
jgi:hypothetical protein